MIDSIFSCLQKLSLVVFSLDKAEVNIYRREFKDEATKTSVDDEKAM